MKKKTKELDVDFIGEQASPLTEDEELAISNYLKMLKEKRKAKGKRISAKDIKHPV